MIRKKPAPDLIRGGDRFSEKIMLEEEQKRNNGHLKVRFSDSKSGAKP